MVSMPESTVSHASSASSAKSLASSIATVSSEQVKQHLSKRLVRGEKNVGKAIKVLAEADELELKTKSEMDQLMLFVCGGSPEGEERGYEILVLACDLVRREQDRLFGRMAFNYANFFREMKPVHREIVIHKVPEIFARMVAQTLYVIAPYARSLLTRRCRKQIKKKISYWILGIENGDVDTWNEAQVLSDPLNMQREYGTEEHPTEPVGLALTARASVFSSPPSNLTSTVQFLASGTLRSSSKTLRSTLRRSVKPSIMSGNQKASGQGLSFLQQEAEETRGIVEYRKALEDIASDFDRLRRGDKSQKIIVAPPKSVPNSARLRKKEMHDPKYVENHRLAQCNRPQALWHEQGRPSHLGVNADGRSRRGLFDVGDVSPFMRRYARDVNLGLPRRTTASRIIQWS
jgi:hypothetical protein